MDASLVERHNELLGSINVDDRLNGSKLGPNTVVVSTNSTDQDLIETQYMNLHRIPENLQKVQLVTDTLGAELLNQQVVELQSNEFVGGTVGNQYYDDDLLPQDLTEDDKRLAAALVAVQFVQQQKQQHTSILASELLKGSSSMSPLSPLPNVSIDKPGMAAMVTSYIQAFDDETAQHQHLLDSQNQERMLKMYQTSASAQTLPEIRLPPLPPLKKVLSNQSLMRTRYNERNLIDSTPVPESSRTLITSSTPVYLEEDLEESAKRGVDERLKGTDAHQLGLGDAGDGDSDFEGESDLKSSRKSLPHKKRIPKKLKSQPTTRSLLTKGSSSSSVTKRSMYACEICGTSSLNQAKFFEHLKSHYEPPQGTSSNQEPDKEGSLQQADYDKVIGNEEVNLSCGLCGRHFKRQKALETHMTTAHSQIEEFSEPEDLMEGIRHVVDIQSEVTEEPESNRTRWRCSEEFVSTEFCEQEDHKSEGGDFSDFPEDEAGKKKKKKMISCPHCSKTFTHRNSLIYHVRSSAGRRLHQCQVCSKSFFAANALRVHMRMHSGDKPYKCSECGRNFRQWGDLKYHMTSIHSNTRQYQCEFCGKDFARKYSLIVHRRIHTGEKNYVCEFCTKTFRASSYLMNHRRIHTGEKPYNCDVCRKPFRVKSDMKRHRNIHNKPLVGGGRVGPEQPSSVPPSTVELPKPDEFREDSDEFRQTPETNTLYVWIPAATDEPLVEESILPD